MLGWLANAFGFEEVLRYTGEEGYVNHAENEDRRRGRIYMGDPGDDYRNPRDVGETFGIYVLVDDVDAHCDARQGRRRRDHRGADRPGLRAPALLRARPRGRALVLRRAGEGRRPAGMGRESVRLTTD